MIKYRLKCEYGHEFEGWFRCSADFEEQSADEALTCPVCGSSKVNRAIMAPAVSTRKGEAAADRRLGEIRAAMTEAASKARTYVEKNFDYVGDNFPEEARSIHYGEKEARGIYGEATPSEVKELKDEGVEIAPVPGTPSDGGKPLDKKQIN